MTEKPDFEKLAEAQWQKEADDLYPETHAETVNTLRGLEHENLMREFWRSGCMMNGLGLAKQIGRVIGLQRAAYIAAKRSSASEIAALREELIHYKSLAESAERVIAFSVYDQGSSLDFPKLIEDYEALKNKKP